MTSEAIYPDGQPDNEGEVAFGLGERPGCLPSRPTVPGVFGGLIRPGCRACLSITAVKAGPEPARCDVDAALREGDAGRLD